MTTNNSEVQRKLSKAMKESLEKALKRFEVKLFLDWSKELGQKVLYVEVKGSLTGGQVTFLYSYFKTNGNQVLKKLNLIGSADGHIYEALLLHLDDLYDKYVDGDLPIPQVEISENNVKSFDWDDQVSMGHARSVVREFLLKGSRFARQSDRNYDSSKHLGVLLDEEEGLPAGTIAVGFKGGALQAVLNPRGRIQSQKYRRDILGGLAHIGVLDATIGEYDDDGEYSDINEPVEHFGFVEIGDKILTDDGFIIENEKMRKARKEELEEFGIRKKGKKKAKKSNRLDKQKKVTNGTEVKFYIFHFSQELLEEVSAYVAA